MNHWSKILPPLPSSPFFTYRPQNFRQPRAGRSLWKLSSNLVLKAGPSNRLPKAPSGLVPNHFQGREFHHFQHLLLTVKTFFFLYLDSAPPGEAQPLPSSPVTVWPCEDLCVPQRERTSPAALCRALQPRKHSPFRQDSRAALYCPAKTYLHFTAMFLVPSLDPRGMDKDHNDTVVQYPVQVLLNPCSLYSGWG